MHENGNSSMIFIKILHKNLKTKQEATLVKTSPLRYIRRDHVKGKCRVGSITLKICIFIPVHSLQLKMLFY